MPNVCFYFQVHQPYRLNQGEDGNTLSTILDEEQNRAIFRKVAEKCYLPANEALLRLVKKFKGKFRFAFSISGTALEQMIDYSPETLASFQDLVATGCVELLGETYYHSLASLQNIKEFQAQVLRHTAAMRYYFGVTPKVFRNTELVYSDEIGLQIARLGYRGVLAEGPDDVMEWRSPHFVYQHPQTSLKILPKSYRLSDDIAFRFSDKNWGEHPLTAEKFARWVHAIDGQGENVNLFMDYETFGEHQWSESGIFDFLESLPLQILQKQGWSFLTPSEVCTSASPVAPLSYGRVTSWADSERDLTAWLGNSMQRRALKEAFALRNVVERTGRPALLDIWRKLLTSDHFYYMCTKWAADGDVHAYFSPYKSPYDAFITYMEALEVVRSYSLIAYHTINEGERNENNEVAY